MAVVRVIQRPIAASHARARSIATGEATRRTWGKANARVRVTRGGLVPRVSSLTAVRHLLDGLSQGVSLLNSVFEYDRDRVGSGLS